MTEQDIETALGAMLKAEEWYHESCRAPGLCKRFWRWHAPVGNRTMMASSVLPQEVFDRLTSTQDEPYIFATVREARLMAVTAAARAILAGWEPKKE